MFFMAKEKNSIAGVYSEADLKTDIDAYLDKGVPACCIAEHNHQSLYEQIRCRRTTMRAGD